VPLLDAGSRNRAFRRCTGRRSSAPRCRASRETLRGSSTFLQAVLEGWTRSKRRARPGRRGLDPGCQAPVAWKGIPYVEALGVDLMRLDGPYTLFDGTARDGVPHFPQNVNIAAYFRSRGSVPTARASKSLPTRPKAQYPHRPGRRPFRRITLVLENVPSPDNPKSVASAAERLAARMA